MSKFTVQQQRNLRRILGQNAQASQFAHFGLNELTRYKDFDLLYQSFVRSTPVQDYGGWIKALRGMTRDNQTSATALMTRPGLVSSQASLGVAWRAGAPVPVGGATLKDYGALEQEIRRQTGVKRKEIFRVFDYTPQEGADVLPLEVLAARHQPWWQWDKPAQNLATLLESGRSRYQLFHALYGEAQRVGPDVKVLCAPARLLTQFALYVARQRNKFTALKEIFPKLEAFVQVGPGDQVHQMELRYLFNGLTSLQRLHVMQEPTGVMAWQPDVNLQQRLSFLEDGDVFYEFIPRDDMDASGRLYRNFRRYHAGQLTPGKDYALLVTNSYGLIAHNTGWLVKVVAADAGHFSVPGTQEVLNGFGEAVPVAMVSGILQNINDVLGSQGLFLRDYAVGCLHAHRRHHWVLEVSRPLNALAPKVLESIGKRLHAELELQCHGYRQALQQAVLQSPQLTFVGMGTFAALPDGVLFHRVDTSSDLRLVNMLVQQAGSHVSTLDLNTII